MAPDVYRRMFWKWVGIIDRCVMTASDKYPRYGGRGITVCERWRLSFEAFLEDVGEPPTPDHSVDRIDNDGPYSPENCRWATPKEQAANRRKRSCTRMLTANGVTKGLADWARDLGIKPETITSRLRGGWPEDKAVTVPRGAPGIKTGHGSPVL